MIMKSIKENIIVKSNDITNTTFDDHYSKYKECLNDISHKDTNGTKVYKYIESRVLDKDCDIKTCFDKGDPNVITQFSDDVSVHFTKLTFGETIKTTHKFKDFVTDQVSHIAIDNKLLEYLTHSHVNATETKHRLSDLVIDFGRRMYDTVSPDYYGEIFKFIECSEVLTAILFTPVLVFCYGMVQVTKYIIKPIIFTQGKFSEFIRNVEMVHRNIDAIPLKDVKFIKRFPFVGMSLIGIFGTVGYGIGYSRMSHQLKNLPIWKQISLLSVSLFKDLNIYFPITKQIKMIATDAVIKIFKIKNVK